MTASFADSVLEYDAARQVEIDQLMADTCETIITDLNRHLCEAMRVDFMTGLMDIAAGNDSNAEEIMVAKLRDFFRLEMLQHARTLGARLPSILKTKITDKRLLACLYEHVASVLAERVTSMTQKYEAEFAAAEAGG